MELNKFSVTAHLEYIPHSIDSFITFCEGLIKNVTSDPGALYFLKSAIDEFTVNALEHGYQKSSGKVRILVERFENHISLSIYDNGIGMDLSRVNLDREARTIEDLKSRGWALSILHHISGGIRIVPNNPCGTVISLNIPVPMTA